MDIVEQLDEHRGHYVRLVYDSGTPSEVVGYLRRIPEQRNAWAVGQHLLDETRIAAIEIARLR